MPPPVATEPLWELVAESLEEAAFLWGWWEGELRSPTRSLDQIWTWTEDRLHGALAGVLVAGDSLVERALPDDLQSDNPSTLAACGYLLATARGDAARLVLRDAVRAAEGARLAALMRGVEVAPIDASFAPVAEALDRGGPEHNAALASLKAFLRAAPGDELTRAFQSGVPALQAAALHATRLLPEGNLRAWVSAGLAVAAPQVRLAAIETGVLRRSPAAWSVALNWLDAPTPECGPLLRLVAMLGQPVEQQRVLGAMQYELLRPEALWALGHVGTQEAAATCVAAMQDAALARAAGEAYCAITGAELERDRLAAPEPETEPPDFEAEDLDASLLPAPADLWPMPDPEAVRHHWQGIAARFAPGTRYVRGQPASIPALIDAVERGPMLRRPDLLVELFVRTDGRYDVEPRAFRDAQWRMMAAGRAALMGAQVA